ncbi:DNA/RNA polymerase [Apiospora arundinis]
MSHRRRLALSLAQRVFTGLGLIVAYGDTDSCMLVAGPRTNTYFGGNVNLHIDIALAIFHRILDNTPMHSLRLARETTHSAMLFIDKKLYAYKESDGSIKTKGLSSTRKDRMGIWTLELGMISKEVRYEGNTCYSYTDDMGDKKMIPVANVDSTLVVPYDREGVYKSLEDDMNRLCGTAGLGTVSSMIADADIFD